MCRHWSHLVQAWHRPLSPMEWCCVNRHKPQLGISGFQFRSPGRVTDPNQNSIFYLQMLKRHVAFSLAQCNMTCQFATTTSTDDLKNTWWVTWTGVQFWFQKSLKVIEMSLFSRMKKDMFFIDSSFLDFSIFVLLPAEKFFGSFEFKRNSTSMIANKTLSQG